MSIKEKKAAAKAELPPKTGKKYFQGVGRRKTSIATVRIYSGKGDISVNERGFENYFPTKLLRETAKSPLQLMSLDKSSDVTIKVSGGGSTGQSEAVRHALARALVEMNPDYRKQLKVAGFLARDPREKERKKPGLRKARRAPQWAKR